MRWHIVSTLFGKEIRRLLANRGSLALIAFLVVAALLVGLFGSDDRGGPLSGAAGYCFIDYWADDAWIDHLRRHVPESLQKRLEFRPVEKAPTVDGVLVYPAGSGAIQMRLEPGRDGKPAWRVTVWQPATGSLSAYETWFWRESARYFQSQAAAARNKDLAGVVSRSLSYFSGADRSNDFEILPADPQDSTRLGGGLDMRRSITSSLILFALFFSCVYLLPSLMCEERERGLLLAQALSPASAAEIFAGKLFYPLAGSALASILAGIVQFQVLLQPFFWLVMCVAGLASLGISLTIASLSRNQRAASMGALCYMLAVALVMFICQQGNIAGLPNLAMEYHVPRLLNACLAGTIQPHHWAHLAAATSLAGFWCLLAACLFRQRGWQ